MSHICEQTSLSRGGLYRHYSSTAEIFKEIVTEELSFDDWEKATGSAVEILQGTLNRLKKSMLKKEDSLSLAIYEFANIKDNQEIFLEIEAKARKHWTTLIRHGMKCGEFKEVDKDAVTDLVLYYYQGIQMWARMGQFNEENAKRYEATIKNILVKERKNGD